MALSVILTTYREPEVLDLCLKSAIEGQVNKNEIIVVVDGFYDENKHVLEKYKDHISVLDLEQNVGMIKAMNLGHYNAYHDLVFHIQDDNIFPLEWDVKLESQYVKNSILVPNQIEPYPSIFKQFVIKDFGRSPEEFKLDEFWEFENKISESKKDDTGSSFPILISKKDYLKIGGFDEAYPGPWVVDWEFFMKCSLNNINTIRSYKAHFYHFVSIGTKNKTPEQKIKAFENERLCHDYFRYKWGDTAKRNPENNKIFV